MRKPFVILFLLILSPFFSLATHLRAGQITVRQDPGTRKVWITITVFTKTINTNVLFGGDDDILDFGDGSDPDGDGRPGILVPETENIARLDLGNGVATASFTIDHTYNEDGVYLISYSEPNRNESVINMDGSVNTRFYIETMLVLAETGDYTTPTILTAPIFEGISGQMFYCSMASSDTADNRLYYEIQTPRQARFIDVINYRLPENFEVNPFNGQISWDTKFDGMYMTGEFNFAVRVTQVNSQDSVIGYLVRDFQIILQGSDVSIGVDENSNSDENGRVHIPSGATRSIKIIASGSGVEELFMTAYSELVYVNGALTFQTYDSVVNGEAVKIGLLRLTNMTELDRTNPFNIAVRISAKQETQLYSTDLSYLFYARDEVLPPLDDVIETPVVHVEGPENSSDVVYPNPAGDLLVIRSPIEAGFFELIDSSGRRIQTGPVTNHALDISSLLPGSYMVIIHSIQRTMSIHRIVKQ